MLSLMLRSITSKRIILMNVNEISLIASSSHDGKLTFPEAIGKLIDNGVAYYHVDYVACSTTYYSTLGATVLLPIEFEGLPVISENFDVAALKATILESQKNGQNYRVFCGRAMQAGVQGYIAFLLGKRVTYFGQLGDQHTEWFPGAKPE